MCCCSFAVPASKNCQCDNVGKFRAVPDRRSRSQLAHSGVLTVVRRFYSAPTTGLRVQGYLPGQVGEDESYESVKCTACSRVHLVNPKSGKVLGHDDNHSEDGVWQYRMPSL